MREILKPLDMAALNELRANPRLTVYQLQIALDLKNRTTAARIVARLREFGLIGRLSVPRATGGSQFHYQTKAAA